MSFLSSIGKFYGNIFKGAASSFGFDTSPLENDEAQKFQAQQAQMNRDWQESMMNKQMDWSEQMWNKNNVYNSAKAQVQRFRDAGLNPYLMMTGGASAGVGSTPATPSGMSGPSPSGGFGDTHKGDVSTILNAITNKRMADADIRQKNADSAIKEVEAENAREKWLLQLESMRHDNKYKGIINQLKPQEFQMYKDETVQKIANMKEEQRSVQIANAIQSKELANYDHVFKLRCAQIIADTNLKVQQGDLSMQQAQHEFYKGLETLAKESGVRLDNKKKQAIFNAEVFEASQRARYGYQPTNIWQAIGGIGATIDFNNK